MSDDQARIVSGISQKTAGSQGRERGKGYGEARSDAKPSFRYGRRSCTFAGAAPALRVRGPAETGADAMPGKTQHGSAPGKAGSEQGTGTEQDGECQIIAPAMS